MSTSNWLQKQRELCQKLVDYLMRKYIKAVILSDGKKPYVRIFFNKSIHYDCQLKAVKSQYVTNVWLVPKMFFSRDFHYVVYDEKEDHFSIINGIDVSMVSKEEMSTYQKKLVYLVVPMASFIPIHAWVNKRKKEAERRVQKRLIDF